MMPDAKICEAVSVYEPLCQVTLDEARNILSYTQLLTLSCQYLDGLSYLHDKKSVLHRDIKPTNLGLATVNPPWGIILDVDNAWKTTTCTDHMVGTLCFLAPEIVDLKVYKTQKGKNMRQPSPYGCPADVWALGASFWETHIGVRRENICINIARYNEMIMKVNHLDTVKPYGAEYRKILRQMLAWQPDSRILAGQAHAKMAQLEKLQQHEDGRPTIPIEDEEEQPPRSRRRKSEK